MLPNDADASQWISQQKYYVFIIRHRFSCGQYDGKSKTWSWIRSIKWVNTIFFSIIPRYFWLLTKRKPQSFLVFIVWNIYSPRRSFLTDFHCYSMWTITKSYKRCKIEDSWIFAEIVFDTLKRWKCFYSHHLVCSFIVFSPQHAAKWHFPHLR